MDHIENTVLLLLREYSLLRERVYQLFHTNGHCFSPILQSNGCTRCNIDSLNLNNNYWTIEGILYEEEQILVI
jgi:hypothetical protein